jgi:hypothetical protein
MKRTEHKNPIRRCNCTRHTSNRSLKYPPVWLCPWACHTTENVTTTAPMTGTVTLLLTLGAFAQRCVSLPPCIGGVIVDQRAGAPCLRQRAAGGRAVFSLQVCDCFVEEPQVVTLIECHIVVTLRWRPGCVCMCMYCLYVCVFIQQNNLCVYVCVVLCVPDCMYAST